MSKNLSSKLRKGLSPEQFISGMTKNQEKFKEWYDAFTWENEADKEFFESLNNRDDLHCLILAADWCGDVVRNVPAVFRALEISGIPTEVLIKEEHPDVMADFLTMGGEAIPIVIFYRFQRVRARPLGTASGARASGYEQVQAGKPGP